MMGWAHRHRSVGEDESDAGGSRAGSCGLDENGGCVGGCHGIHGAAPPVPANAAVPSLPSSGCAG